MNQDKHRTNTEPKRELAQSEPSKNPDELQELLESLIYNLPNLSATEIGWEKISEDIQETVQAIDRLANKRALETRIDELKLLVAFDPNDTSPEFDNLLDEHGEYMGARIAELKGLIEGSKS